MKWVFGVLAAVLLTVGIIWAASSLEAFKESSRVKVLEKSKKDQTLVVDIEPERHGDYIVYCDEERFQQGFDQFRRFVRIKSHALTAPGGPMLIALADVELSEELQAPQRVLIEALKRHAPQRVVIMAHEGCLIYDSIGAWYNDPASVRQRQMVHLRKARDVLQIWFPRTHVEVFYGDKIDETRIQFSPVPEEVLTAAGTFSSP